MAARGSGRFGSLFRHISPKKQDQHDDQYDGSKAYIHVSLLLGRFGLRCQGNVADKQGRTCVDPRLFVITRSNAIELAALCTIYTVSPAFLISRSTAPCCSAGLARYLMVERLPANGVEPAAHVCRFLVRVT